ncbi:MAG: hypothetical protein LW628_09705 [Fimbriimonadaceae bacterium]|nr:hypothetical protein [Fimbriimonadaceae bacterium]MCE2767172.1 hypothetical protein [Fimbriimonadaceae bacterium]
MLMVIIVIAVISAIAIPKVSQQIQLAKERSLRAQLRIARIAVERLYNDTGHYPQRMSWLNDFDWEVTPTFPGLTPMESKKTFLQACIVVPIYLTTQEINVLLRNRIQEAAPTRIVPSK